MMVIEITVVSFERSVGYVYSVLDGVIGILNTQTTTPVGIVILESAVFDRKGISRSFSFEIQ